METVEAFVEECMREGKEGTLPELIAMRHREMTDQGYVKNEEGFWVKPEDARLEWNGTNNKKHG